MALRSIASSLLAPCLGEVTPFDNALREVEPRQSRVHSAQRAKERAVTVEEGNLGYGQLHVA